MTKNNSNPIHTRIGAGIFILAIIFYFLFRSNQNQYIGSVLFIMVISGLILMSYGLIKIDIGKDKNLEKFLRLNGKIMFVLIPLIVILPILGLFSIISWILLIALAIIILLILGILRLVLIVMIYKHIKKK